MQVFCTVSGAGSKAVRLSADEFNVALVDEAAQLVEAESCILFAVQSSPRNNCKRALGYHALDQLI